MSKSLGKTFVGSVIGAAVIGLFASAAFAATAGIDGSLRSGSDIVVARGDGSGGGNGNGGGGGLGNGGGNQKFKKAGKKTEPVVIFDQAKPKKLKVNNKRLAPVEGADEARQIIVEGADAKPADGADAQAFVAPEPGTEGTVLTPAEAEAQGIDLSKVEGFKKGDDVEIRVIEVPAAEAAPQIAVEQPADEAVEADGFVADEEPVVVKTHIEKAYSSTYKKSYGHKKSYSYKASYESCH